MLKKEFKPANSVLEKLNQRDELENQIQLLENIKIGSALAIPTYIFVSFGLLGFNQLNPKIVNQGYANQNFKPKSPQYCTNYNERFHLQSNKCELPPLKNLSDLMLNNAGYMMAICSLMSALAAETRNFKVKQKRDIFKSNAKRNETVIDHFKDRISPISDFIEGFVPSKSNNISQSSNLLTYEQLFNGSKSPKAKGNNNPRFSNLQKSLIGAGLATGAGVLGLGGYSYSKFASSNEIINEPQSKVNEYERFTRELDKNDTETDEQLQNRLEPKKYSVVLKTELAGKVTKTPAQIQKFRNLTGRYMNTGTNEELYLACNIGITECKVANSQPLSTKRQITGLKINKQSGASIASCPDSNIHKAIETNHSNGWETLAVLGTGTVAETNPKLLREIQSQKSNHVFAFQDKSGKFRSPAGDQFVRFPNGKTLETNYRNYFKRTGQNIGMRDAGFYTMKDGKMYLLDFLGKSVAERDQKLDELSKNLNVQSFSMTGWVVKPQNHEIYNNKSPQARTVYVFNEKTNAFQGVMYTPPIRFDRINIYAKKMYGKDAIGLNLDGDFYAGMLDLRGITAKTIESKSITQRVEMYYQQSGLCLVVPKTNPKLNQLPKELMSKAQAKADERRSDDKVGDFWEQFFGVWNRISGN
jgi:hypothetical protein